MTFYKRVEELTRELVACPSVVTSAGEKNVAQKIYDFYASLPYFRENPEDLSLDVLEEDGKRANVRAMIRGKGEHSERAVLLFGHLDTVGVEDYGEMKKLAFDPDRLEEMIKKKTDDREVLADLETGDYLFGRGALDMKSGVAIHMALMEYYGERIEGLNGTLIALAECDEEGNAEGIFRALEGLGDWKDKYKLEFQAAINSDYSTPQDAEDEVKAIYFGSIGKLLPTFFVVGKGAHVGDAFSGFDPNLFLSHLTSHLDYNPDYSESNLGHVTVPPVSLKQGDMKDYYDVQTPIFAYAYYNYFTLGKDPAKIMSSMKDVAKAAFSDTIRVMNKHYQRFCQLRGQAYEPLKWESQVYTWEEFYGDLAMIHGEKFHSYMHIFAENLKKDQPDMDIRDFALAMMKEAWMKWATQEAPAVIVANGSTFYAPVALDETDSRHKSLLRVSKEAMEEVMAEEDVKLELQMYYPFISDSSFVYLPKDLSGMQTIKKNTPSWGYVYEHPVEGIRKVAMPVINMGTWGKDGHEPTERVYKPYTFGVLPELIQRTIDKLLEEE